jgi:flavin reductase (DIM6/NTAB) family NADH-FMN oxidoreductase RutF
MRFLTGAVTVVATRDGDARSGLTATAVCSFSALPPRLLTCVNLHGATFRLLANSRCISVNVLARHQETLARRFAGLEGTAVDDHFAVGEWCERSTGAPVLKGTLVSFDCIVAQMFLAETHAIVIGDVKEVLFGLPQPPLLYLDGKFLTTETTQSSYA